MVYFMTNAACFHWCRCQKEVISWELPVYSLHDLQERNDITNWTLFHHIPFMFHLFMETLIHFHCIYAPQRYMPHNALGFIFWLSIQICTTFFTLAIPHMSIDKMRSNHQRKLQLGILKGQNWSISWPMQNAFTGADAKNRLPLASY